MFCVCATQTTTTYEYAPPGKARKHKNETTRCAHARTYHGVHHARVHGRGGLEVEVGRAPLPRLALDGEARGVRHVLVHGRQHGLGHFRLRAVPLVLLSRLVVAVGGVEWTVRWMVGRSGGDCIACRGKHATLSYLPRSIFSREKEAGALTPPSSEEAAEDASPRRSSTGPRRLLVLVMAAAAGPRPRRVRWRARCMGKCSERGRRILLRPSASSSSCCCCCCCGGEWDQGGTAD